MQIRKLTVYEKIEVIYKLYKYLQIFKIIFIFYLYTKICKQILLRRLFLWTT
ncbi:hypothetical protein EMIT079MI2_20294 [Bacillus sp. IT-79MI2]